MRLSARIRLNEIFVKVTISQDVHMEDVYFGIPSGAGNDIHLATVIIIHRRLFNA